MPNGTSQNIPRGAWQSGRVNRISRYGERYPGLSVRLDEYLRTSSWMMDSVGARQKEFPGLHDTIE